FSSDFSQVGGARLHFVTVGTPQRKDGKAADLRYVEAALASLQPHLSPGDVVAGKSTVPVGSATRLAAQLERACPGTALAWNPEFLREGWAVQDSLTPNRLVFGLPPQPEQARAAEEVLREAFAPVITAGTPLLVTNFATAELVKVSANAFLATKISFINAMAEIAEATGADVTQLADAVGYDDSIGPTSL